MAGAPATISDNEVILRIGATERRNLRHHKSTILALKLSTFRLLLYEADCECPDCLLWVQALQHHRYDFVVQLLSCVQLFATPCTATCQASLSFTISWSLLKLMSIESMISSNYLILCHPLLFLPSIFPSIRVFSKELAFHIRWPKYQSFSFSISHSSEYSGLISFRMDWFDLLDVWETLKSLLQCHSSKVSIVCHSTFFMVQLLQYMTAGKDKIGEDSWDCWAPGGGQANQAPGLTTLQHDKTNSINVKPELQFAHRLMMISVQVLVLGL